MALTSGGGRYEKHVEALAKETGGDFVMVLVAHSDPNKCGFSCAMSPEVMMNVPAIVSVLRQAAQQFEEDLLNQPVPPPSTVDDEGSGSFPG